jgi:hypothetical protein
MVCKSTPVAKLAGLFLIGAVIFPGASRGQGTPITISPAVPNELNPSGGGAPTATPEQAAAFAWQEFIALNWPADYGQSGQRDKPSTTYKFGDPTYVDKNKGPLPVVWETFRGKVEIFPGDGNPPPGYPNSTAATSWGYDVGPAYDYGITVAACDRGQMNDPVPWINLDETDQITLDNMYAGVVDPGSSSGNSAPQLIRFLAKANRVQYVYVAGNSKPNDPNQQWWSSIPSDVVTRTKDYLAKNKKSPTADSKNLVSLPFGTIETKAGWRPLNPAEISSHRFHTQMVRFYEGPPDNLCYRNAVWGLVALHIIQKTQSAPYFIYATFEQADNILTADGKPVEDADGNVIMNEPAATSPQVCLVDPKPQDTPPPPMEIPSQLGSVIVTGNPAQCKPESARYCGAPGSQLYLQNDVGEPPNSEPSGGNICVNKRENAIPDYAIAANKQAHAAMAAYFRQNNIPSAPWLAYKLVNVQYYPYDKIPNPNIPNGSPYTAKPPYTAKNPAPSSYYQANIVVETNRSLQLFSGGLSPYISTDWNSDGTPHKNTYYDGGFYNMGGCMGCHGSQGQNPVGMAGDFSVILARGAVTLPETPASATSKGLTHVRRNRSLTR